MTIFFIITFPFSKQMFSWHTRILKGEIIVEKYRFAILTFIVSISGFSQGMLLTLSSIMLEKNGVSPSLNGLNASSLYLGLLLASPFMEKPLRKFGYKPLIIVGLASVLLAVTIMPFWQAFWVWFVLRFIVGVGDHMLHFSTQTWITSTAPRGKMGRTLSLYGLSFGAGFALGPLTLNLTPIHEALPFFLSGLLTILAGIFMIRIKNEFPEETTIPEVENNSLQRFKRTIQIGGIALLPGFTYGFLESSLNGSFPIYALRNGLDIQHVSFLLPTFVAGSLISQVPLGMLSDRFGRKQILSILLFGGTASFFASIFVTSPILLGLCFLVAGMLVGSLFSLGISYMADLLPKYLLPAGNILAGMAFGIGSISGPLLSGTAIDFLGKGSLFIVLSTMLFIVAFLITCTKSTKHHHSSTS